jgi:HNH endonuclease
MKAIDRLLFAQGGLCFFCERPLMPSEASVEHLVATASGGNNSADNCVVCCKALNSLLGRMSLKEKLRVVLNQKGQFMCPNRRDAATKPTNGQVPAPGRIDLIVADLRKRGAARPRALKTLHNTVAALFQKQLAAEEIESLISHLEAQGIVIVDDTKVSYELPPSAV